MHADEIKVPCSNLDNLAHISTKLCFYYSIIRGAYQTFKFLSDSCWEGPVLLQRYECSYSSRFCANIKW